MDWLIFDDLLNEPYRLRDFEILDNLSELIPHDRYTKQPLKCHDFCHKYWRYSNELSKINNELRKLHDLEKLRSELQKSRSGSLYIYNDDPLFDDIYDSDPRNEQSEPRSISVYGEYGTYITISDIKRLNLPCEQETRKEHDSLIENMGNICHDDPELVLWKYFYHPSDIHNIDKLFAMIKEAVFRKQDAETVVMEKRTSDEIIEQLEVEIAPEIVAEIQEQKFVVPVHPAYQMRKDKKAARSFVEKEEWQKHPEIEASEMARRILTAKILSRDYSERVIKERWIKDLNPRYKPGEFGRKKKPK